MAKNRREIKAPSRVESIVIKLMILIGLLSFANFLYFFYQPAFRGNMVLYVLLSILIFYGVLKKLFLWYHYFSVSVPDTPILDRHYEVDIFTTYFPGEPYEMTLKTLIAIQEITYPHTTYLCDEANDSFLKLECEKLGVIHVTRDNRVNAKAGNINNALKMATGEICLILDPDHVPKPNFLDVVLPHFTDEKIGFVQVVQAYYNKHETLVARGAAEQTFQFYGPMMMAMNTYGTVNAIGANCTFRRAALDSIGGHAPGLAEDMHTAMLLYAEGWKSVYVPKIVAKGLVPADLTSYYKQQLKWSRGSFELLYSVYPRIFKKLSTRQKIHFALLPLHYLIGFIYLISFLIPILSLFMSEMPWTGNFLYFIVISLPVYMSSLMIRTYIQKWVIDRRERGFHVIGGILQIITWWVYVLGVFYTFSRKKIPFLPTPKSEDEEANFAIVIPNICIGILSVFAIIYGLNKDLTPFSLIMGLFALLNAVFMFASVYGVFKLTNRNRILRANLAGRTIDSLKQIKELVKNFSNFVFNIVRRIALPILIASVFLSNFLFEKFEDSVWENVKSYPEKNMHYKYYGIFAPSEPIGISDIDRITKLEQESSLKYQIVSLYIPWGESEKSFVSKEYFEKIKEKRALPMISWEPWSSGFVLGDSIPELRREERILHHIAKGDFDKYIQKMALDIQAFGGTVFLRFAHEFDNPGYPWSSTGKNTSEDFKKAWRHVHNVFNELDVQNVKWVWNPWKENVVGQYYPGDDYVDWIGVTLLNYGRLNSDGEWYEFENLYNPFHEKFKKLSYKPVLITEMGSLKMGGEQKRWFRNAFESIDSKYSEINGVVFFNSSFDKNIPFNNFGYSKEYLDWSFSNFNHKDFSFFNSPMVENKLVTDDKVKHDTYIPIKINNDIKGVGYEKFDRWTENNYVATRKELNRDFQLMKEVNINYIKYHESSIYDQNVLKYSKRNHLKVLYVFDMPSTLDFIQDGVKLDEAKKEMIKRVKKLKDDDNIKGWVLKDDIWANLKGRYSHFELLDQTKAYYKWLYDLIEEIKVIDSKRYVVQEIQISQFAIDRVKEFLVTGIKIDAFGLEVHDGFYLDKFLKFTVESNIQYLISGINVRDFVKNKKVLENKSVFIKNWQNQWRLNTITFNGLVDFRGKKKVDFYKLKSTWNTFENTYKPLKIRILKPSMRLMEEDKAIYHALIHQNGKWVHSKDKDIQNRFEWIFVKYDEFGLPLAIKPLGRGTTINVKIPKESTNYNLFLTYTEEDSSTSVISSLNTPLHSTLKIK